MLCLGMTRAPEHVRTLPPRAVMAYLHRYGLHSYGVQSYGLHSYGLRSYALYSSGDRKRPRITGVTAHIVMARIVMAYIVMAYTVMAHIVMAYVPSARARANPPTTRCCARFRALCVSGCMLHPACGVRSAACSAACMPRDAVHFALACYALHARRRVHAHVHRHSYTHRSHICTPMCAYMSTQT